MSKYVDKRTMMDALNEANIEFDENATVPELRKIYDKHFGKDGKEAGRSDEIRKDDDNKLVKTIDGSPQNSEVSADFIKSIVDAVLKSQSAAKIPEVYPAVGGSTSLPGVFEYNSDNNEVNDAIQRAEVDRLNSEIAVLQKRREMLALNDGFDRLDIKRFDFVAFEAMVHRFSGDDSYDMCKWFDDLDDAFSIFGCSEGDKFIAARRLLDGTAKLFLRTISVHTYDELKKELIQEFGKVFTMQEVFHQLKSRVLKPTESVKRYVIEMQEIAMRAKIPESDLIDIIIDGLNDKSQHVAMLYSAKNMKEFKSLLDRYEKKRSAGSVKVSGNVAPASLPKSKWPINSAVAGKSTAVAKSADTQVRCFNCSQFGHYQGQCQMPKRPQNSCFNCAEVGHYHQDCPKKKRTVAAIGTAEDDISAPLDAFQLVSVAFLNQNKCTELIDCVSLFDTGSRNSFIQRSLVPFDNYRIKTLSSFTGVGNKRISTYGFVKCHLIFKNCKFTHNIIVLPDDESVVPLLIGRDLLDKMNIRLCRVKDVQLNGKDEFHEFGERVVSALKFDFIESPREKFLNGPVVDNVSMGVFVNTRENVKRDIFGNVDENDSNAFVQVGADSMDISDLEIIDASEFDDEILRMMELDELVYGVDCMGDISICDFGDSGEQLRGIKAGADIDMDSLLDVDDANALKSVIVDGYLNCVSGATKTIDYSMKIRLSSDVPLYCGPRRLSFREKVNVQETLDDLLGRGIIRPSESPYASPIVLVRRKNGNLRMCVDYRALNKITIRDNYPLPVIEDCLGYLGGKKYFTTLDLRNGFHHVKMSEDSIPYTAFVTPLGQFEYCNMPFGLKNAPAVFQRFINTIFRGLIDAGKIVIYLDDISIATETFEEHIEILTEVLTLVREYGLELNLVKCKFAYREIEYLGYLVSEKGIRPSDGHIRTIKEYPMPTNAKELLRCLGLFSYFRRFVENFSRRAKPLTQLTKKDVAFEWTNECTEAFLGLRETLANPPVLAVYNPFDETELHTDASSKGFGAVLLQRKADGKFHPVSYFSKTTSPAESRYHSFELETLAIIYALGRFRMFLEGIPFTIVTDCNSLILTLNRKQMNPRIARWALELENYDYKIRHRKGMMMPHVDALSRVPMVAVIDGGDVDLNIQIAQARDETIQSILRKLENGDLDDYVLENGLVFRRGVKGQMQLYVPQELEDNVMRLVHEKYGHVGIEKCVNQIQKHYWFPKMREKLNYFIRNCLKCIYYSPSARKNERSLYNIPKKPEPFDTIHIDHFGPLPSINSKRKHILVVVDGFTKFVKLYAVNAPGTKEAICALRKYFENYSRPRRIVSDRGTCFTSNEFANFMLENNIHHVKVSVASPQSNGQVERINRDLKAMLAKLTEPIGHADWVRKLSEVEFAMNNTVHSSIRDTPSKLLFGIEQRGAVVDELTEHLEVTYSDEDVDLVKMRGQASEAIRKSQTYNQQYFDQHHKPAKSFEVGDFVVIKNVDTTAGTNKKFIPKYRGPYVVQKQLGHDRYLVTDVDGCQITQVPYRGVIDSSRLRKWLEPGVSGEHVLEDFEGNTEDGYEDYEFLDDQFDSNI